MSNTFTKHNTLAAKAVGIVFMLTHHLFSASQLELWSLHVSDTWLDFSAAGKLCVGIFMFLSGYGLTLKYESMTAKSSESVENSRKCINRFVGESYLSLISQFIFVFLFCQLIGLLPFLQLYKVYGEDKRSALLYFVINGLGLSTLFRFPTLNPTWWYISMAIIVIVLLPIIILAYKRVGISIVLICALLSYIVTLESGIEFFHWLFCLALSVMCAEEDLFARLTTLFVKNHKVRKTWMAKVLRVVLLAITISIFLYMRKFNLKVICNGVLVLSIIWLTWELLPDGSVVQKPFLFLGRHATNIFLVHTLIYQNFGAYIYASKKPFWILLTLLISSLLVSLIIEGLKKVLRYERLVQKLKEGI